MSNLFGMIHTGISGINAAQVGIAVTGNNVANMKNPTYSRQTVSLGSKDSYYTRAGYIGTGVNVLGINRSYDEVLAKSVRNEASSFSYYNAMSGTLKESMLYFNELEAGSGLGDSLKQYFNSWQELAGTAPDKTDEAAIKRRQVLEDATTLTAKIREGYASIKAVQGKSDDGLATSVQSINAIAQSVAELNDKIRSAEATGQQANDMRDARDNLVDQLSTLTNITSYERETGEVALYIGGQTLVDGTTAHKLVTVKNPENSNHYDIHWQAGTYNTQSIDITSQITGGEMAAALKTRDELLEGYLKDLDNLASSVIQSTNRVHASGQGLERFDSVSGGNGAENPRYPFNSELGALSAPIKSGSFRVIVYDSAGKEAGSYTIDVDPLKDNMNSIAEKISAADGSAVGGLVSASLDGNNSLTVSAAPGYTLSFADDTSDFLMASGINGFFKGTSAKDIDISDLVASNPNYIASNKTGAPGDNSNAKLIADIQFQNVAGGSSVTVGEFYGYFIGVMGTDKSQIDSFAATKKMAFTQLNTQLTSMRGVSEQEELVNMSMYQRMFEINSRFINIVDEMLNTVINGLGTGGR